MNNLPTYVERTPEGKVLLKIDASLFKDSNCMRKVFYTLCVGLTGKGRDFKMEYGTAFHKGLHEYYESGDKEKALTVALQHYMQPSVMIPDTDWRTVTHLGNALKQYFTEWQVDVLKPLRDAQGVALLEQSFAMPLYASAGVEVLLCGTIDMLAVYGGQNVIVDHKTTSLTNDESYLDAFTLSPQLMTYVFVHRALFPKMSDVGAMINGVFLGRTGKNRFKRSPVFAYSQRKIAIHGMMLRAFAERVAKTWEAYEQSGDEQVWMENYTCCEEKYGMCRYAALCKLDDPVLRKSVIDLEYDYRHYNPLLFQK